MSAIERAKAAGQADAAAMLAVRDRQHRLRAVHSNQLRIFAGVFASYEKNPTPRKLKLVERMYAAIPDELKPKRPEAA